MTDYTTADQIASYLNKDLTTNEIDALAFIIPAVKKYIDNKLDTNFSSASSSSRYYDGGCPSLDIDPCTAITAIISVDADGNTVTTYESDDYLIEPVNETVKREVRARFGNWPAGKGNIKVTALFSEYNNGVPDDIQFVATRLASSMLNSAHSATGVNQESIEGHSVSYDVAQAAANDPVVMDILNQRAQLVLE